MLIKKVIGQEKKSNIIALEGWESQDLRKKG